MKAPLVRPSDAQAGSATRTTPAAQGVERIGRRLDEENPQVRIRAQEAVDQVLVASPHVVPRLERDHDEGRHRSTCRYTSSVA
ncbi:hypothetical protein [Microbacterium tenebrionis]|uniref:hypothetical protein n=1 Tax=Microbacterium tenebrionis TaxID=2830665 RepID=UPI0015889626|nr:hypothetical protein [Microbacterium ihumii]